MANTQAIRAGRAFVELFADDTKLVRGLRQAEKKLKAFGESIRKLGLKVIALGSAMAAPLIASTKIFTSYGDSVAKMARRTGLSVEALSELEYAATQSGVEVTELESSFRRMQRSIYDAGRGMESAKKGFAELGLSYAQLKNLSPEQQFKLLALRIARITDPTQKAAVAMTIFGRSGAQLLPLFADGARGIELLQAEARSLGLTMSTEDAHAAESFKDALSRLWKVIKMGAFNIGAALAPTLQDLAARIMRVAIVISTWIKENRGFIVSALKVTAVVIAVGIALTVLGTIISALGTAFGVLGTIISAAVSVFNVIASVISWLATPVGLVIAAIVALGATLLYVTGAGSKALSWLGDRFKVLKDDAVTSFNGIADALASGDISLAAKILWLALKMEWTRGINFLEKIWLNFRNFFIKIGYDAWHGLLVLVEVIWHALEVGWISTVSFFGRIWDGFVSFFAKSWENIKAGAQKTWNWIKNLFDSSFDLQAENRFVEEQKKAAIASIDDESRRRAAERVAKLQRSREQHNDTMAYIGEQNLNKRAQLDAEYASRMAENEADLARARQEWRDAVDLAKKKRAEKASSPNDWDKKVRDALAGLGDIGEYVQAEAAKIGVYGTFNAASVQGLAAGNAADRTAIATEETAKNTKRLVQAAQSGGLRFA